MSKIFLISTDDSFNASNLAQSPIQLKKQTNIKSSEGGGGVGKNSQKEIQA